MRIPRLSALAAILLAVGVFAAAVDASAQSSGAQDVEKPTPIASISGDWNKDGALDGALLFTSEEGASLFVYFGGQDGSRRTSVLARDVVWHGPGVAGQEAGLQVDPEDAEGRRIILTSQNAAIGRNRWSEQLTLIHQEGALLVASYERAAYDTLDLDWRQECKLDFIKGEGALNGQPIRVEGAPPLARDWTIEQTPPDVCAVE